MSISSVSTVSSQQSTNSQKNWNIFKNSANSSQQTQVLIESPPLDKMLMDHKLTKLNSRFLSSSNGDKQKAQSQNSNIAYDSYQGLLGLSTQPGIIEIFDLKGERKTRLYTQESNSYKFIRFYPNRPYIMAINDQDAILLINYHTQETLKIRQPFLKQELEKFSVLYIPDFYTGQEANEDFAFLGTDKANIFVFSIQQKAFVTVIINPIKSGAAITDIKSNHKKPHRLLICYQHSQSSTSSVIVHSFYKNKEVQRLEFIPGNYQELGQAMAIGYNHEANRIAVVFSSGKVQIFKAQSKLEKGKIRPLQQLELDNTQELTSARITWKNLTDGKRQCCQVFYSFAVKKLIQKEIAIFLGQKGTKASTIFTENNYLNQLQNGSLDIIQDCIYMDLMIPNQNKNITDLLLDKYQKSKKLITLKARQNKQKMVKSQVIIALTGDSKLFYCCPNQISKISDQVTSQNMFNPLENNLGTSCTIKHQIFVETQSKNSKDFIHFIENLNLVHTRERFFEISKDDTRFIKAINKKETQKYATHTELESFLSSSNTKNEETQIIGYIFAVNSQQEFLIRRIESSRTVQIIKYDLKPFINDEKVTALVVDKKFNKILISLTNAVTCELQIAQSLIKTDKGRLDMSSIDVSPLKFRDIDPNEQILVMKTVNHNQKQNLLIQGFNNGRVKILNTKTNKIIFNAKCMNDESSITCIESQQSPQGDQISFFCGTSNGHIQHIILNNKETKIVKSKQISFFKIKQLISTDQGLIYILTDKQVLAIDKQSFSIKFKYELNQKEVLPKECFKNFNLIKLTDSQYSIACLLKKSKWLLMFDSETLICYCVYDMLKMNLNPSQFYSLYNMDQTIITTSASLQTQIFTFKKQLELSQDSQINVFDKELAEQKFPKSDKKSGFTSLFHKNITIKQCIDKQLVNNIKIKQRSHSVGEFLHQNINDSKLFGVQSSQSNLDENDQDDSPRLRQKKINQSESNKDQKLKQGFAILSRNKNQSDTIVETIEENKTKKRKSLDKEVNSLNDNKLKRNASSSNRRKSYWA